MCYAYPAWCFIVPALVLSSMFLHESIKSEKYSNDELALLADLREQNRRFRAPEAGGAGIACTQIVSVAVDHETKVFASDYPDPEKKRYQAPPP